MLRVLGTASSIAFSLIISWAALHYDTALLVAGLTLLVLSTVGVLAWRANGGSFGATREPVQLRRDEPAEGLDDKDRALFYLERARDNGFTAYEANSRLHVDQALNEIVSALGGVGKAFGFGSFEIEAEAISRRRILRRMLNYVDSFYFLLKQGHIADAKRVASDYEIG